VGERRAGGEDAEVPRVVRDLRRQRARIARGASAHATSTAALSPARFQVFDAEVSTIERGGGGGRRHRERRVGRAGQGQRRVDLVGEHQHVVAIGQRGDRGQRVGGVDDAGRVVRRAQHVDPRAAA
jgi:hypothetical protein